MKLRKLLMALSCMLMFAFASAQNRMVSGIVTDQQSGAPLSGVSVLVKGTTIGVQTDEQGKFSIEVPSSANTLLFTSIGYADYEAPITDATMNVQLQVATTTLNEVVVIGYGTVLKKDLTGSVATVTEKDFQKGQITTPEQLITGKVAGVSITPNGNPGGGGVIRIRGGASLVASNDPLIVIDGVPLSGNSIPGVANQLGLINPNDIETFTVLKDAASTAIYGSRASNGVILITTKKGKKGKAVFNFNTQFSVSNISDKVDVLSANEFRDFVNEYGDAAHIALLGNANTDWQDEIYQTALSTNNNLSVSGSWKNMPYRVSVGYLNQEGVLITDKLERYSASIRLSPSFWKDHLKVNINLNGSITSSHFANQGAIGAAVTFDPTQPVYADKDKFGGYYEWLTSTGALNSLGTRNPVALIKQKDDNGDVDRSYGNVQLDYKFHFLPDLHVNYNFGFDLASGDGDVKIPDNAAQAWNEEDPSKRGSVSRYKQDLNNYVSEVYLNYVKDIPSIKSNINATAGYGYYDNLTKIYNYASTWASGDTIPNSIPAFPSDIQQNTLISIYGRLIYTFDNKYILAGSIRRDGSSRFAKDSRWGTFPSVAFTWRASQEKFLNNSKTISTLNVRASFGVTGQQDGIANYSYWPVYFYSSSASQYQFGNTFYQMAAPQKYDENLKWEQTSATDVGLDFGFFKNRITGTVDYYYKKTKDLLSVIPIPAGSNFGNRLLTNVGNITGKGVEVTINAIPIKTATFSWDFGFNFSYNELEITKLTRGNDPSFLGNETGDINGATGQQIQINSVDYAPYSFFVYKQVYDAQTGKPIEGLYEDLNRDGQINDRDRYHYKSPNPRFVLGFSTNLSYKKWTLNFVMRANFDNYVYDNVSSNLSVRRNVLNPLSYLQNATKDIYNTEFVNNQFQSDYYIKNGSFLKMDNIGLGYNVGKLWNEKANLSINFNCQNVFIITNYKGLDPEIFGGLDRNLYPRPRFYVLDVNLDF